MGKPTAPPPSLFRREKTNMQNSGKSPWGDETSNEKGRRTTVEVEKIIPLLKYGNASLSPETEPQRKTDKWGKNSGCETRKPIKIRTHVCRKKRQRWGATVNRGPPGSHFTTRG